jgi:hypothetical protein
MTLSGSDIDAKLDTPFSIHMYPDRSTVRISVAVSGRRGPLQLAYHNA